MIEDWIVKRMGIIAMQINYQNYDPMMQIRYESTSDLTVDLNKFENFIDELYEQDIEQKIREEVPAVQAAYEKYRTLLTLAKSEAR